MVWFDFEMRQSFIVENRKQHVTSIRNVLQM